MSIKIWEVEFGYNYDKKVVEADRVENALIKAWKLEKMPKKDKWISKIELLAETDD